MNTKIQDILLKSIDSEHIQLLSDTDLVELHKTCKFENNTLSGFAKSNSMKYLPLVENEITKRQDTLRKSKETDLEKGGEGSKGGKVIGHTKSGKPIYENSQYHSAGFTHEDHSDAMTAHMKASKEHSKHADLGAWSKHYTSRTSEENKEKSQHHSSMAQLHQNAMNQKLDEGVSKGEETDLEKSESHKHQDLIKSNIANSFKTEVQQFDTSNLGIEKETPENKPYESEPLNTIQVGIERQKSFADNLKKTYE